MTATGLRQEKALTAQPLVLRRVVRTVLNPTIEWAIAPLVLLDAACLAFSMFLAYKLRFDVLAYHATLSPQFYAWVVGISIPIWLGVFALYRLYDPDMLFGGLQEYAHVLNACTIGLIGLVIYTFVDRRAEQEISRGWLTIVWFLAVMSVTWMRFGYRRLIYWFREHDLLCRRALIVGVSQEGLEIASQLQAARTAGVKIAGFVDPDWQPRQVAGDVPVLGPLDRLESLIRCLNIQDLVVIPTALKREELLDIYRDWGTDTNVRIHLSSGLYELFTTGAQVREVGFVPLISLNRTRITGMDALMKAVLDYGSAFVGLVLLAPVFLIMAILIKLDSPGPVFHRRRVVGLGGAEFDAFKFRTMVPDADTYLETHPELKKQWEQDGKIQDDPRITRIGRILRRTSLDELPQLVNILRGEMSLVGPRMITRKEMEHFGRWQHNLLTVKPALTGLWQISGRSDLTYAERVHLDMQYIRNYTIWLDLKIVFNTIWILIQRKGAY